MLLCLLCLWAYPLCTTCSSSKLCYHCHVSAIWIGWTVIHWAVSAAGLLAQCEGSCLKLFFHKGSGISTLQAVSCADRTLTHCLAHNKLSAAEFCSEVLLVPNISIEDLLATKHPCGWNFFYKSDWRGELCFGFKDFCIWLKLFSCFFSLLK